MERESGSKSCGMTKYECGLEAMSGGLSVCVRERERERETLLNVPQEVGHIPKSYVKPFVSAKPLILIAEIVDLPNSRKELSVDGYYMRGRGGSEWERSKEGEEKEIVMECSLNLGSHLLSLDPSERYLSIFSSNL